MCAIDELEAGWTVGAAVLHPKRPQTQLLAANTELTPAIIKTLRRIGVDRVWITGDGYEDFDMGASRMLTKEQRAMYDALKEDFAGRAKTTITCASMQKYKQRVNDLILTSISSRKFVSLAARLRTDEGGTFAHAASVAYLCVVGGLELESYIIKERPKLAPDKAIDHAALGLAGLLHDVGKTGCDHEVREQHEVHLREDEDEEAYREHVQMGYRMLESANAPASVRVAVRMHHQRWDGAGWPSAPACGLRDREVVDGRTIHIYSRIVGAANVLDNLLQGTGPAPRLAAAALYEFASDRFEGWFDPVVRTALLRAVQPFAVGSRVVLSDGTACAVAAPNPKRPCLPCVKPLESESQIIDLATDEAGRRIAQHEAQDVTPYFYDVEPRRTDDAAKAA